MITLHDLSLDDWATGISCSEFDLGWPASRSVVTPNPRRHGSIDESTLLGSRLVSLTLDVFDGSGGSRQTNLGKIRELVSPAFTGGSAPGGRPILQWQDPTDQQPRWAVVRGDSMSAPMVNDSHTSVKITLLMADPRFGGTFRNEELFATSDVPGATFDISFDASFPAFIGGPSWLPNEGSASSAWTARIFGPCTGPILYNRTTGESLSFPGLEIADGDWLEVDSQGRTAYMNGDEEASRYSFLDFSASTWWEIPPGGAMVEFSADLVDSPARTFIFWVDSHL